MEIQIAARFRSDPIPLHRGLFRPHWESSEERVAAERGRPKSRYRPKRERHVADTKIATEIDGAGARLGSGNKGACNRAQEMFGTTGEILGLDAQLEFTDIPGMMTWAATSRVARERPGERP